MANSEFSLMLPIQGPPLRFSTVENEPVISRLTGKSLRRCQISFTVAGEGRNDEVNAMLAAANASAELISDTQGGQWKVGNRSESFQQGSQMYHHVVDLEEQEELALTGVEIDGMTLTPERWKVDGPDMLTFLVSLDSDDNPKFEQILERRLFSDARETYFSARLFGVNDAETYWSFGECLWQSLDGGGARHLVRLVPKAYDDADSSGPGLFQPERTRLMQQSVVTKMRLDALIEELHAAGVLGAEALARINRELTAVPFAEMREFNRANDVDEFFD